MKFRLPKLYQIGLRFPKSVLFICAVVTLISYFGASKLEIESDLTALLPKGTESVASLEELKKYFGGSSYLFVTVDAADTALVEQFSDEIVSRIEQLPSVLYVDYRHPIEYFKKRFWLYIDFDDLKEMEDRLDRALLLERKGISATFSDVMDFAEPLDRPPDLTFTDIFRKYEKRAGLDLSNVTSDDDGRFVVLRVKARGQAEDIEASRAFVADIKRIERELKADPRFGHVSVGYTGNYQTKLEEVDLISSEIAWVSTVVLIALFLILLIYFGNISAAILVAVPLMVSLLWTGELVYLILGHLNMITGFGAAILGGLGSDYGIYLLTRYYQEREQKTDFHTACRRAFSNTGSATYGSMVTGVGSFLALIFSSFGVFVEFGIVGALGIFSTYVVMMLMIPAILTLSERYWQPLAAARWNVRRFLGSGFHIVKKRRFDLIFAPRRPTLGILISLLLCSIAAFSLSTVSKIYFEGGQLDSRDLPGNKLYERVSKIISATLNPTVLVMKGAAEEERVVAELSSRLKGEDASQQVYNDVFGLSTFVPKGQDEKRVILARMKEKTARLRLIVKDQKQMLIESLTDTLASHAITREDLPEEVQRVFVSPVDRDVYSAYLFPAFDRKTSEDTERYRQGVMAFKQELNLRFTAADGEFVVADTVQMIQREAPRGLILILLFLAVVLCITIRSRVRSLVILAHLVGGLILLSGVLWIAGIKLNILNIAMITIILGTGIDSYIHFSQRFDESGDIIDAVRSKVPAVFIANLTSIVGFGGLLLTTGAGIRSIGWVAVLGLAVETLLAIFIFPRCLVFTSRSGGKRLPS